MSDTERIQEYQSRVSTTRTEWGAVSRVDIDGRSHYFTAFWKGYAEHRAQIFEALCAGIGSFNVVEQRGVIPTEVACAGKAAIAAYLYSIHQATREEIGEELSVTPETISQYLADVKAGRRL